MRFLSTLLASILGTLVALGLVFFFGLILLLGLASAAEEEPEVRAGSVLTMTLSGPIPEQVSGDTFMQTFADEPSYDLRDVTLALRKAAADDRIEGIWLELQGVEASWATLQALRRELIAFKDSGKPLYASGGEYAMDEANYFLASAADSVFADPEAFFEFNGFALDIVFFKALLDKLGVEPQIVRAGTFKSAVEPFMREDLSEANEEQLTALLESQNRLFMEAVAESRRREPGEFQRIAEEEAVITATQAHELGLIDALLYEDEVIEVIAARLGLEDDEPLEETFLEDYVKVPLHAAGLDQDGDAEIAVVYAVGTIVTGESSEGTVGSKTFTDAMREAEDDEDVQAIVVRINSPGGSAVASDAMWREIALSEKPVVVSMGDYAASGGYWIATAAPTLVAEPLTLTGSIGVFSVFFDAGDFFEDKLGITFDGVQSSPYADMFSGVEPLSDAERALLQRATDETYALFLDRVAESRGLNVAQVDSIGQGRVWTGEQAFKLDLIDRLGSLDDAIAIAAREAGLDEGDYRIRALPRPRTFFEALEHAMGAQATQVWQRLGASPAERAYLRYARLFDDLVAMQGSAQARLPVDIRIR